ncbi:hypothetical protein MMC07_001356 [Pseudocyphellaria aurata]|nr:hypothetical protein [Pseudocyphellaria aurata]
MSSPLSSQPHSETLSSPIRPSERHVDPPVYRSVKLLPFELREHCKIYFEETLYSRALKLLISLVASGNTSIPPQSAFVPPPHHLAFVATLAIHPTLTTRARSDARAEEANLALRYLRLVLKTVGPINANLAESFLFTGLGSSSRRRNSGRRKPVGDGSGPSGDDLDRIDNDLAESEALWARAEDIWQVVGWAFNCSVLHKKRWTRWSLWLDYMLDVLQKDWDTRGVEFGQSEEPADDEDDPRKKSIIVRSLNPESRIGGKERKLVRAVFADGGPKAAGEFTELWRNETKERKKDVDRKKIETRINIEMDEYGDYMEEEKDSDLEDVDPESPEDIHRSRHNESNSAAMLPDLANPLGGMDAINLRLRILSLLSTVSAILPHSFTPLASLYDLYLEHIRPLPLPTFFLLMSPASLRHFHPGAASSLAQYILHSIIASSAPLPAKDDLTQNVLEDCYLPFAANTSSIADNAKVSLCVETLLRILNLHLGLAWTPRLQDAMEEGIHARDSKAKKSGRKLARAGGDTEREWLVGSANRIRSVVMTAKP